MEVDCEIRIDVILRTKTPVPVVEEIHLQQAETWLKYKLYQKIKMFEDEINERLNEQGYTREKIKLLISQPIEKQEPTQ
jgi:hypothetical protein